MLKQLLPVTSLSSTSLRNRLLISGPCSVESENQILDCARELVRLGVVDVLRAGVWKPRTRPGCFEGIGKPALNWLVKAGKDVGVPVATEVANASHVIDALNAGVDILWLGARTTANPFAVQEIAEAISRLDVNKPVLVKNPVNPDLELWIGAIMRLYNCGIRRIGAIHRGFTFYGSTQYRNMPLWQIPLELHRRIPNLLILHDPSHTGGKREYINELSQAALDMGFNGLMIESHTNPDKALSDGGQQLTPSELMALIDGLQIRDEHIKSAELNRLRLRVDEIDRELISMLSQRMEVCREIGEFKKSAAMPVVQPERYERLVSELLKVGRESGLSDAFLKDIFERIHVESVRQQVDIINGK